MSGDSISGLHARWQELHDWLTDRIDADLAIAEGFADTPTAAAHLALVSANRATLGKMRELGAS